MFGSFILAKTKSANVEYCFSRLILARCLSLYGRSFSIWFLKVLLCRSSSGLVCSSTERSTHCATRQCLLLLFQWTANSNSVSSWSCRSWLSFVTTFSKPSSRRSSFNTVKHLSGWCIRIASFRALSQDFFCRRFCRLCSHSICCSDSAATFSRISVVMFFQTAIVESSPPVTKKKI